MVRQATPGELALNLFSLSNREIFQGSSLGVVESTLDRRIVFANKAALEMLGADSYEGLTLDLAFTGDAQEKLNEQLKARQRGQLGNYRTLLSRVDDPGKKVEVDITGLPLYDAAGKVSGALGIFRSLEQERVTREIREYTLKKEERLPLLEAVALAVKTVLPFDLLMVSRMNPLDRESESYFTHPRFEQEVPKVWFPLDEEMWGYMKPPQKRINDFNEVMRNKPWNRLQNEPMVVQMRNIGLNTTMWRVICRADGEPIASISLMSRVKDAYSDRDLKLFDDLPLAEAVLRALDNDARRIEKSKLELLKELNHCNSVDEAGELLARKLLRMFDWSHVAVYRVDYSSGFVRLIHGVWKDRDESRRKGFQQGYAQHITAGVLGQVVHSGEARNVPNVKEESAYLPGPNQDAVLSELACPVRFDPDNRVRFIINLNDDRYNAFSKEDVRVLKELAGEVAGTMQRISHLAFLSECFDQATDPIIATDAQLRIRRVNPAAAELLGLQLPADATGKSIIDYFDDPAAFEPLKSANPAVGPLGELRLKPLSPDQKAPRTAYVTCNDFPQSLGGFVFLARDLREMRRKVRIELLENAAYELAVDTRTPLTLAMAEIERLRDRMAAGDRLEVEQVLKLLGKVKNTYTRLAMFNSDAREKADAFIPLSLSGELRATITALPNGEEAKIVHDIEDAPLEVMGDHNQLGTVFGALLSVLLRSAPESQPVRVRLKSDGTEAVAHLAGRLAPPESRRARRDPMGDAYRDLRMASPLLRSIMKAHGGRIEFREDTDGYGDFELRLPLREASSAPQGGA